MIAFLRGRLLDKQPNRLILDVHGVGYDVQVPLSTFYAAGDPGAEISLHVHTHVREDQIALYGFSTALEREIFEKLIGVSGIGPKVALAVLSGIEAPELAAAVAQQDVARLTSIPGIGRKTAERLVLELKDRLPAAAVVTVSAEEGLRADLLSALLNLGYQRAAVERVLDRVVQRRGPEARFETLLREALRELTR